MKKLNVQNGKRSLFWLQTLIVAITLIVVTVVIFFGSQTFRETKKMSTEQFNQQQLILARSAANSINAYFKELVAELSSIANIPEVQQMTPECLKYMQHSYYGFPTRTSIRRLDSNGVLRMIYPFEGWRGKMYGRDYSKEVDFQEAKGKESISVRRVINEQGEARIRVAVPVYLTNKTETVKVGDENGIIVSPIDPERPGSGRFHGVLVGSFDPQIIARNIISLIVSGKTGYAWVLDEDGIFVAHHEKEFIGRYAFEVRKEINPDISYEAVERIQKKMIAGEEGVGRYISGWHRSQKGKVEKLVAYTSIHIDNYVFSIAVCAPVSEVEEIIHLTKSSEKHTLVFVILALIIGGLCIFIITYRWSHSLELEVAEQTRKIRETSNYLNNLIKHTNSPIIVWNQDKKVTIFNEVFEKISGWTEAEMMNQPLEILFPEKSRSDSMQKIETISNGEYWESVEIPILHKDGNIRVALWNSANIYAEDSTTLLATIVQGIDITERKQAEKELQKRLKELEVYYKATLGREGRIIELKHQVNELLEQLGKEKKYNV